MRRIAALLEAKEYQRAAAFAGEGRKQHPDDPRFVRLQARALFDGGDRSGAILLLALATLVIRYGSSRFPSRQSDGRD